MTNFYPIARSNIVQTPNAGMSNDNSYEEASFEGFEESGKETAKGLENNIAEPDERVRGVIKNYM
jgi:hypothetical protein